jgi:uncharacterized protein YceK
MKLILKITQQITVLIFVFLISGCASIVSDSKYPVSFTSSPAGAKIEIYDEEDIQIYVGQTPTIVTLDAGKSYFNSASYRIVAKLANGQTNETKLTASMDGWFIGNIVFGGLIGFLGVDPLTGAMYKLPDSYSVDFAETVSFAPATGINVITIEQLPEAFRAELIPLDV